MRFGALDSEPVFVVGCPRSGTTFFAGAIGSLPGFVDLGEVPALKGAIPELSTLPPGEAAPRIRRIVDRTRRFGLVGSQHAVEQTPESAFLVPAIKLAYPEARVIHVLRDGRDVVCSLLERGWLTERRQDSDDAGLPYGTQARFWVEPERQAEFEAASDARRAAWAWRRYVTTILAAGGDATVVRYERMAREPDVVARELAPVLGADESGLAGVLRGAHTRSIGRYARDLTPAQLADVEAEAGPLLAELGY